MILPCGTRLGILTVGLLACGCASAGKIQGPVELLILHTNDMHGKFTTTEATWKEGSPPIGGLANLSAYIERERSGFERVLVLDAGDFMTGNPICDLEYEGITGAGMVEAMNRVGYDAVCLGNHEFDHGLEDLYELIEHCRFPLLSANTYRPDGSLTAPARFRIIERNGLRIGLVGLLTEELYGVAAPKALAGTSVAPIVETAREMVRELDPKTDVIVLMTHVGVDDDKRLAREVAGIDVIVGGHSHTRLKAPVIENGVIIVQTGANCQNLGKLRLTVENDRVVSHQGELIELWPMDGGRTEVRKLVDAMHARIDAEYGIVIGELVQAWDRSNDGESNIGNWLTDRMRDDAKADFAVLNSGGIRKDVGAGPLTKLEVLEVLPFYNYLTTFECTGTELLSLIVENARAAERNDHSVLQVSGIRYAYAPAGDGVEVIEATVGGKPIEPAATYRGVTVDFLVQGNAKRYFGFVPSRFEVGSDLLSTVIIKAVEATGRVDSRLDGRIRRAAADRRAG